MIISEQYSMLVVEIVFWVILGIVTGWITALLNEPDSDAMIIRYMLIGAITATVAGGIWRALTGGGIIGFNILSLVIAFAASILVFILLKVFYPHRS